MSGASVTSASRGLGLAASTVSGRTSALAIYDKWKSHIDESWASLKAEYDTYRSLSDGKEQIGDFIKRELLGFSIWIVNEDIKQRGNTDKDLGSSSLMQYFGQVKEVMRDSFPDLPIWKDHDEAGQWYNILRQSTSTGVIRRLHRSDDDTTSIKVRPMVRRLEQDLCCLRQRLETGDWEGVWANCKGRDLENMCEQLLAFPLGIEAPCEYRAVLIALYLAGARGSEAKFLKWNTVWWDDFYQCAMGLWTQIKVLNQKDVPFVSDHDSWAFDFYHAMGCYGIEGGFYRSDPTDVKNAYMFRQFVDVGADSVASKITTLMKKLTDEKLKDLTSSRGIRRGFNSFLAAHLNIHEDMQRSLGGFARADNSEKYTMDLPALILPPARALANWPNTQERVYPPSLNALLALQVDADTVAKFAEKLFVVSVPELKPGGRLESMTKTMVASLIMYHPEVSKRYPNGNLVVETLRNAAKDVGVGDEGLLLWSKAIKDDFISKNYPPSPRNGQEKADIETLLKKQTGLERMLMQDRIARRESEAKNNLLSEEVDRLRREHRCRDEADAHRDAQIQHQRAMLEALLRSQGIDLPAPPPSIPPGPQVDANKRRRLSLPPPNNVTAPTRESSSADRPPSAPARTTSPSTGTSTTSTAPTRGTTTAHLSAAAAAATATAATGSLNLSLRWTDRTATDTRSSDANITISYALQEMSKRGLLQNVQDISMFCARKGPTVPFIDVSKNGKLMNNCLRLVKKVWTEEEKNIIYRPPVGTDMIKKEELMIAADAIQKRCLSEMIEYEKSAGMEPKTKGSAKYTGLGGRIRAYEKYLKDNPSCGGKTILNSSST